MSDYGDQCRELRAALTDALDFIAAIKKDGVGLLSEGIHAGLRKGTDAPDATALWNAIAASRSSAWGDAISYALDPFFTMWGGDKAISQARAALREMKV